MVSRTDLRHRFSRTGAGPLGLRDGLRNVDLFPPLRFLKSGPDKLLGRHRKRCGLGFFC